MKYLPAENILQIHFEVIEAIGGAHGLRDLGLLESAAERPRATFGGKSLYPNLFLKGAALVHSLLLNHPFTDGNKRTAVLVLMEFFLLNGKEISATQKEVVDFALWIENQKPEIEEIAAWIKKHSRKK
ncbi:MAG: type II toxin-antitoxin system death-on-curing family toxin [Patescibacteria group bacterium]